MRRVESFLDDLRATSKPSEKQQILKDYDSDFLQTLIYASYEPFKMYHVKISKKDMPTPGPKDLSEISEDVQDLLDFCEESMSPKQNKEKVIKLLSLLNKGSQDLLIGVLNKNWKVGLGTRNILKVFPNIISRFEVQLANTFNKTKEYKTKIWEWSYKLDGLRCVALRQSSDENYDKGKWTLYTRKGKEFLRVNHLKEQLENMYQRYGCSFFDGELYKHGLTFEEVQSLVMGFKEGQSPDIEYHVFVGGVASDFLRGEGIENVEIVTQSDQSHIKPTSMGTMHIDRIYEVLEEAFMLGFEGLMLRDPNKLYDYKRSDALIKIKKSEEDEEYGEITSDCVVDSIEFDDFPVIENGKMHYERLLVRLWVIQEDGIRCKVGSGYNLDFRRKYTEDPEALVGSIVEVEHQQWGANGRMRFPRFKRLRLDL
jgi:DNA ligase-1